MSVTSDQLGQAIIASGLLTAEEMKAFWKALPPAQRSKDGEPLAKALVEAEKLTEFQAAELLSGSSVPLMLGNYVLIARIGAGGMGQVIKAEHRHMRRLAAIKFLPPALTKDEAAVKRFQREVQAARGLVYAHAEGIVHRDIKPAHLLIDKRGTVVQKIMAHMTKPIPSLKERRPDLSDELEQVFLKMVAKQPEDRYQTAGELVVALDAVLRNATQDTSHEPSPTISFSPGTGSPLDPGLHTGSSGAAAATAKRAATKVNPEHTLSAQTAELDTDPHTQRSIDGLPKPLHPKPAVTPLTPMTASGGQPREEATRRAHRSGRCRGGARARARHLDDRAKQRGHRDRPRAGARRWHGHGGDHARRQGPIAPHTRLGLEAEPFACGTARGRIA